MISLTIQQSNLLHIGIQFGAGNIGRGFIGPLLARAGYSVLFVDVVEPLVEAINRQGSYTIKEISEGNERAITVQHVRAINGKAEAEVVEAIGQAAIITTAVGPNVLRVIAKMIAKGLQRRAELGLEAPLNLIACENLIDNSKILHDHVFGHLPAEVQPYVEAHTGFPCCVVDRVVTNPSEAERAANPLAVIAEGQGQWIVDRFGFVGEPPAIEGMKLVDNLAAYVEQKIFTLNTAHAATGYLGYLKGYKFIHQALQDPEIYRVVMGAIEESSAALIKRHGLNPETQKQYALNTLKRFADPTVPDPIVRVVREPQRKLAPNDRLIKPALLAIEVNVSPANLATAIAAALLYNNPADPQAVELAQALNEKGIDQVLEEVSGLPADHPLAQLVKEKLPEVEKLRQQEQ